MPPRRMAKAFEYSTYITMPAFLARVPIDHVCHGLKFLAAPRPAFSLPDLFMFLQLVFMLPARFETLPPQPLSAVCLISTLL